MRSLCFLVLNEFLCVSDKQLAAKDSRIKLMNEILPGIKVLKLYAWELPFMDRVNAVRAGEITILKYLAKLWALTNFTFACSPFLVTVVVFTLYTTIDPVNHVLDASKIFVSMSLFGLMRLPLTIFPWALTESIKLFVSLKRINKFLNAEVSVVCYPRKFWLDQGNSLTFDAGFLL